MTRRRRQPKREPGGDRGLRDSSSDRSQSKQQSGRDREQRGPSGDRRKRDSNTDRGLRSLVTTRPTQLPFDAAMRAREVAVPTAEDLARAAEEITLVRRHYVPPTPFTPGRGAGSKPGKSGKPGSKPDKSGTPGPSSAQGGKGGARRSRRKSPRQDGGPGQEGNTGGAGSAS